MALRAMYKGFKKVLAPLIINRPGELAIDQDALNTELNNVFYPRSEQAVSGQKNFFLTNGASKTDHDVAITVNNDGSVKANGLASGDAGLILNTTGMSIPAGDYIASTGTEYQEGVFVRFYATRGGQTVTLADVNGTDRAITIQEGDVVNAYLNIANGKTVTNKMFYPMISFAGGTYAPYTMTNDQLTEDRYFHVGETVNVSLTNFSALLTASAKEIRCTIPFMKSLAKVTGISFKSTTRIAVRKPSGGYLIDGLISGYTVSVVSIKENLLCFKLEKADSSAFDGDNNSCIDLAFTGGINDAVITFS